MTTELNIQISVTRDGRLSLSGDRPKDRTPSGLEFGDTSKPDIRENTVSLDSKDPSSGRNLNIEQKIQIMDMAVRAQATQKDFGKKSYADNYKEMIRLLKDQESSDASFKKELMDLIKSDREVRHLLKKTVQ